MVAKNAANVHLSVTKKPNLLRDVISSRKFSRKIKQVQGKIIRKFENNQVFSEEEENLYERTGVVENYANQLKMQLEFHWQRNRTKEKFVELEDVMEARF